MMRNDTKVKILLVDTQLPPYRIPLYNALSEASQIDLSVLLCSEKETERSWTINNHSIAFKYKILKGVNIALRLGISRTDYFHIHFNMGYLRYIKRFKPKVIILSEYASFTHQILLLTRKMHNIPTILWYRAFGQSKSKIRQLLSPYINHLIMQADALIVPGKKTTQYSLDNVNENMNIHKIGNPVDNRFYNDGYIQHLNQKSKLKQKYNIENKKIILFLGRFSKSTG